MFRERDEMGDIRMRLKLDWDGMNEETNLGFIDSRTEWRIL